MPPLSHGQLPQSMWRACATPTNPRADSIVIASKMGSGFNWLTMARFSRNPRVSSLQHPRSASDPEPNGVPSRDQPWAVHEPWLPPVGVLKAAGSTCTLGIRPAMGRTAEFARQSGGAPASSTPPFVGWVMATSHTPSARWLRNSASLCGGCFAAGSAGRLRRGVPHGSVCGTPFCHILLFRLRPGP